MLTYYVPRTKLLVLKPILVNPSTSSHDEAENMSTVSSAKETEPLLSIFNFKRSLIHFKNNIGDETVPWVARIPKGFICLFCYSRFKNCDLFFRGLANNLRGEPRIPHNSILLRSLKRGNVSKALARSKKTARVLFLSFKLFGISFIKYVIASWVFLFAWKPYRFNYIFYDFGKVIY